MSSVETLSELNDGTEPESAVADRRPAVDRVVRVVREPVRWVPWVLAALPALWMARFVRRGSHLHYGPDYWEMFPRAVTASGGLDIGGLLTFQNEHPVAVAQFLFWVNTYLTGGSNIWLGLLLVGIVMAQVVVICLFLRPEDRRTWAGAALVVAASVLLFSRHGVHNFVRSMSGAAWLTANLFVVAAILARVRDRTWLAAALGVLASASYGTGLVVWPVLLVVGMLRDRRWIPDWRVAAAGVVPVVWFLANQPTGRPYGDDPGSIVEHALLYGGAIFTGSTGVMRLATVVGAVAGVVLSVVALRRQLDAATPWIGLFLYGGVTLVSMSYGRTVIDQLPAIDGAPSRYASPAALFWISVIGLAGVVVEWGRRAILPALVPAAAAVAFTSPAVDVERDFWLKQQDLAVGIRVGLEHDVAYVLPLQESLDLAPLFDAVGHYPFSSAFDADCGLLDEPYDPRAVEPAASGAVERVRPAADGDGIRIIATLPEVARDDVACVVVGDDDRVVGVGTPGLGHPQAMFPTFMADRADQDRLAAVAPTGSDTYRVLLVTTDERFVQVGDDIEASVIEGPPNP